MRKATKTQKPRRCSIVEARTSGLPALIRRSERGPIGITRRGQPVAVVLSMKEYEQLTRKPDFYEAMMEVRRRHADNLTDEEWVPKRDKSPGREVNPWD